MEITVSEENEPFRAMIYGIEGVGKSQFGAHAPSPIGISPEGGLSHLRDSQGKKIPFFKGIKTFPDVLAAIKWLIENKHEYQSLLIDTADWVEKLCHVAIIGDSKKDIVRANGGYGAGFRESEAKHKELIALLTELREKRRMNIVITAHYHVKTVKDPEAPQDYDSFEIKCHELVSSLWREWVDVLLFARFETHVKVDDDKSKGRAFGTDKRIMYTQKRPAFQAKNRYGLPAQMNLSFEEFYQAAFSAESDDEILKELEELKSKLTPEDQERMTDAMKGANRGKLIAIRNHARKKTQ